MKVRTGFVSNSSSLSFIVSDPQIKTTAECAFIMLEYLIGKYDGRPVAKELGEARDWVEDNLEYNMPIVLPWTCNYETWIWSNHNGVCVDTCNNHNWWDMIEYDNMHEDWKWEQDNPHYKGFHKNWDNHYLDLSNMSITSINEFVDLWTRRNE